MLLRTFLVLLVITYIYYGFVHHHWVDADPKDYDARGYRIR